MGSSEKIEKIMKGMSFKAGTGMDERLWAGALRATIRQKETAAAPGRRPIWEIVMKRKAAQLTIAAILLVAALAVGVETLRSNKLDKAHAFRAEIHTNMAIDLDPRGALPLAQPRPEDFDVTWDAEGGGAMKTMAGSTVRIIACPYIRPGWDGAVSWAYTNIEKLKECTATRVNPTEQNPFVVVLTSEGNLAVIEIGGRTKGGAWLSWRVDKSTVPQYGPVQTVTLHCADKEGNAPQECGIDLDTDRVLSIPLQVLKSPSDVLLEWLERNGVDAIANRTEEGYGLNGIGLVFWTWPPATWAGTSAVDLRQEMASSSDQPRSPMAFKEGQYQSVQVFKTREGGIGMLQLLSVEASKGTVQFRYRLVQDDSIGTPETAHEENPESQQLADSQHRLMQFGLLVLYFANDHNDQLPQTVEAIKNYAEKEHEDYRWIVSNVEYLGAGLTTAAPGQTLLAYDKTLLMKGKGTHVLFLDSHSEFWTPERIRERGLGPRLPGNPTTTRK